MKTYTSKIKRRILSDLESISSPGLLIQIFDYLKLISLSGHKPNSNKDAVLALAGTVNDADEVNKIIDQEFNTLEGEW